MTRIARGIVLRCTPFRDHSQILRVLTTEAGKLSLMARGSRQVRGKRWHGDFEVCEELSLRYYPRRSGGLHLLAEAGHATVRPRLRGDLRAWGAALYGAGLADQLIMEEDPMAEGFGQMQLFLDLLQCGQDAHIGTLWHEIRLLYASGFLPSLSACPACHQGWGGRAVVRAPLAPGFACHRCAAEGPRLPYRALQQLQELSKFDAEALPCFTMDPALVSHAVRLCGWILLFVVGRFPPGRRFAYGVMHQEDAA